MTLLLSGLLFFSALDDAQLAYIQCLGAESDAALRERVPADLFAQGALQICEDETAAFRAAAMPMLTAQADGGGEAAEQRFATMDAANRTRLIQSYAGKLRARRGVRSGDSVGDEVPQ
ncbi:hypothetical protein [Sphingomonas sp. DBB INV C78]|uniref:hypothetical protein n=1 Tax=Sphingomonas sp. DBB INV C78 TaxID=3349434 RepID=UPI0036D30E98